MQDTLCVIVVNDDDSKTMYTVFFAYSKVFYMRKFIHMYVERMKCLKLYRTFLNPVQEFPVCKCHVEFYFFRILLLRTVFFLELLL